MTLAITKEHLNKKRFGITGAAGFIAPRHLKAIKDNQCELVAAVDPHDCVGIIDSYFPESAFFVEFERFDRYIDNLRRKGRGVDIISICSPNYLHDAHCRTALRNGSDAICEKPLVLNVRNLDMLRELENETGKKIHSILQLRHHPAIQAFKKRIWNNSASSKLDIDLTYITSRGRWYDISWKGDPAKSGGVVTNIGIHFFDMLIDIFGKVQQSTVHVLEPRRAGGYIELEKARVRWFLSINSNDIPECVLSKGQRTYRSIVVNGEELEFSDGFTDLHTVSYKHILEGTGFGLDDAAPSIELVSSIRNATPVGLHGDYHEFFDGNTSVRL
jgi:UDP-N-acetyl-2-amino-2-deoxyglucuronate dehydrogenase